MASEKGQGFGCGTYDVNLPVLKSERLVLRALQEEDATAMHDAFSDESLMRWWSSGPHKHLEETKSYVSINANGGNIPTWAVTFDGGEALGWVVLIPRGKSAVREVGYILRRHFWGKGFAKEAVSKVIEHGFLDLKLRRIFADVDPDNAASIALLEALNFRKEERLRAEWETHIGVRDSYIFGLLCDEWSRA